MVCSVLGRALFIPGGVLFIPRGCLIHPHPALIIPRVGLNWSPGMNWSLYLTMASKLQSNCQLEGEIRRHPTWFDFIPVVFWRIKAFHPAAVSGSFGAGPFFDTFIQFLESKSGWESYPTCQRTP